MMRERDREKKIVGFIPVMSPIRCPSRCRHARRGSRAMMTISDINGGHGIKCISQTINRWRVRDTPDCMADASFRDNIRDCLTSGRTREHCIYLWSSGIRKQHWPGLRVKGLDLPNPVVLLVGPCELVLANSIAVVIGDRSRGNHTDLSMAIHNEAISVIASLDITLKY